MARIVKLVRADNATLLPGAVQNWSDLERPAVTTPLLRGLALQAVEGASSVLIAGPHDASLVAEIAALVPTTVVVRSIPDSATLGEAAPTARVLCGHLADAVAACAGFDVVIALDDLTRLHSLEGDQLTWTQLARSLASALNPGGRLLLAIENELGAHRLLGADDPFAGDTDADWCPTWTWDGSRPRSVEQVAALADALSLTCDLRGLYGPWDAPVALGRGLDAAPQSMLRVLAALCGPSHLVRALDQAGRLRPAAAGWVLVSGASSAEPALASVSGDGRLFDWTAPFDWTPTSAAVVERRGPDGTARFTVDAPVGSLAARLAVAAVDADTPSMRALLRSWRGWLDAHTLDGQVDAAASDARFDNVWTQGDWIALHPGAAPRPRDEVVADALAGFVAQVRGSGLRPPWPRAFTDADAAALLAGMAGVPVPASLPPNGAGRPTRQELAAQVTRLNERLDALLARLHWDEKQYFTWRSINMAKRGAQLAKRAAVKGQEVALKAAGRPRRNGQ